MENIGDRVKQERNDKDWSQEKLAEEVTRRGYKIGQSGIGNIESRGDTEPKCIMQLAEALGVSARWLQTGRGPKVPVPATARRPEYETPVRHYVGAGDEVHIVDDAGTDGTFDRAPAPPGFENEKGAACIVRGDSMRPLFDPGDMLYFRFRFAPPAGNDLPIRAVIVQVKDGPLFVKKLLPGTKKGRFHLISLNPLTPVMQDQPVESFAHIEWVRPKVG